MAATLSLTDLPKELLCEVCARLPCQSALDFLLTCRRIYFACNDWTVWRTLAMRNVLQPHGATLLPAGDHDGWKRYVIAAARATSSCLNWDLKDITTWIPQFAALCQPAVVSSHDSFITQLPNSTLNHSIVTQTATEEEPSCFREIVKSSVLHDVQMEQAAAFSLAVQYLSLSNPSDCPYDVLRAVPWIHTSIADLEGMSEDERRKLVAIRHALANRVVGLFAAAMRFTSRVSHPSPPYATTIPFAYQMNLPLPFTSNGLDAFSTCHLPTMADPEFFTESTWTGSFCAIWPAHLRAQLPDHDVHFSFIGPSQYIGGFVQGDSVVATDTGYFPHGQSFEHVVRFNLVGEDNGNSYMLESNNFHSQAEFHRLRLTVQKDTGLMSIHHWHRLMQDFATTDGVITPFGIVTWMEMSGAWMWLWKIDWCSSDTA